METADTTTRRFTVTETDTALAVGSGDLTVLGTPRLLAWCEAVTCALLAESTGSEQTSLGSRVRFDHVAASLVGSAVEVRATVAYVDGRLLRFEVVAHEVSQDQADILLGHGEITRVVVDRNRFLTRLGGRGG